MLQEIRKKLAKDLKKKREENNVSRQFVSEVTGHSVQYIGRIEGGKQNCTLDVLIEIMFASDVKELSIIVDPAKPKSHDSKRN